MKTRRIPTITNWLIALVVVLVLLPCPVTGQSPRPPRDDRLIEAAGRGDVALVKSLLDKGAKVNEMDAKGLTALFMAAVRGGLGVIKLLIDRGADVNTMTKDNLTALMGAAKEDQPEAARLLLEKGADINAKGDRGWTALMWATDVNNAKMVKLLLDRGADVNATDKNGRTALMLLFEPTVTVASSSAMQSDDGKTMVFSNAKLRHGSTVLLREDSWRLKEIVQLLLGHGADVGAKDKDGRTALMRALEPVIEVSGDSVEFSADAKGDEPEIKLTVKNGTVVVKRALRSEIIDLIKAHGATE